MTSINSAFRLRNRIKEKIQHLNVLIKGAVYEKDVGAEEKSAGLDGMKLHEAIIQADRLMDLLCNFNKAIEKANEVNRAFLTTVESLKAKIALYEQVTASCRACTGYKDEYRDMPSFGYRQVRIYQEPILEQVAVVKKLESLKREKNQLEEKLSRSNYETKVDFDTDSILSAL
jgi:hypothetical protein